MKQSQLLQAFAGKNTRIPIWFMRQAGRYLPEYQKIKAKYSLEEMFHTSEIAAQVTVLPVDILDVDAAILFADILTLPSAMGFNIRFDNNRGPVIANPITQPNDLDKRHDLDDLPALRQTVKIINQKLSSDIPLIGFAGAPFTVLCYLLEGGSTVNFTKTFRFAHEHPKVFHEFLKWITKNTIQYLRLQQEAGIKVFQLFDTWGGILRPSDYAHWVLPYVQEIFNAVDLPSIYYLKNSAPLLPLMEHCGADFLSVCQSVVLGHHPVLAKTTKGVQGNLFNGLLYAPDEILKKEVEDVLKGAHTYQKYIFNLSHGVFPDANVDKLKLIVKTVREFR